MIEINHELRNCVHWAGELRKVEGKHWTGNREAKSALIHQALVSSTFKAFTFVLFLWRTFVIKISNEPRSCVVVQGNRNFSKLFHLACIMVFSLVNKLSTFKYRGFHIRFRYPASFKESKQLAATLISYPATAWLSWRGAAHFRQDLKSLLAQHLWPSSYQFRLAHKVNTNKVLRLDLAWLLLNARITALQNGHFRNHDIVLLKAVIVSSIL